MTTVTIDQKCIEAAASAQLDLGDFLIALELPASSETANCIQLGDHGYILSPMFRPTDGLLTISLESDGPLTSLPADIRNGTFGRLLRCAVMVFTGRTRAIPLQWRPFHDGNRISFQADRKIRAGGKSDAGRVVLSVTQELGPRIFAFALDRQGSQDIAAFEPNSTLLRSALDGAFTASKNAHSSDQNLTTHEQIGQHIVLDESMAGGGLPHISLEDWYNIHLTLAQRKLVDHPLASSVRLVGPAGSGKTVTLAIKCLREVQQAEKTGRKLKLLFLTHASSTALAVEKLILDMDGSLGLQALAGTHPSLVITTLYALADRYMQYELDELTPISLDGHEGRTFQADVLNDIIDAFAKSDWIAWRSRCSRPFVSYIEATRDSAERRFFLWELLNEFACVLDAEGVRSATERRDKYLSDHRKNWMMVLQNREEREVILRLYDNFRTWLREAKAIGSDQMIADFLNHLDSYRWEATRINEGFDAIFVDELHLFNRQERMLFRYLLRSPTDTPAVFMAYDAKQSPRDTFLGMPSKDAQKYDLWKDARLGKTEKIELVEIFRYSPQIVRLLSIIDRSFPGQDLDSDWPKYKGIARTSDGPIPLACELESDMESYSIVFKRAKWLQLRFAASKRVAVLCCSQDRFHYYLERPEFKDDFYAITSRDEALGVMHSRKRFILSMPEYVAGLQYDTVLLTDVNRGEVPDGPYSVAATRKFVSQVYLGASRAERRLEIYASVQHGGFAPLLSVALLEGALERIADHSKLPIRDV